MTRRVAILTRPASSCGDLESRLKGNGFGVLSMSMVRIEPVQTLETEGLADRGLIFSSAQAVRILAGLFPGRLNPVYAVGERTAQAARHFGFHNICAVAPTGQALVDRILEGEHRPESGPSHPLTHIRGRDIAFPIGEALTESQMNIRDLIIYSAILVEDLEPQVRTFLARQDSAHVFFWSARAAARFETLAWRAGGRHCVLKDSTALCLSARIAASLTPDLWGRIVAAPTPDRAGMDDLVEDLRLGSCAAGVPPA